jgi:hypothetical protein
MTDPFKQLVVVVTVGLSLFVVAVVIGQLIK